jgi:CRP-like cAMP-binding protein
MLGVSKQVNVGNRILASLSPSQLERISEHLEKVHLETGEVVYAAGDIFRHAYFPITGFLSLVSTTTTGDSVEVAMVGTEGMIGLSVISKMWIIPYKVFVRIATDTLRIQAAVLREEFEKGEQLHDLMLGYVSMLMAQISQSCICHRFHTIEEALSRWLLAVQDRVNSDTLILTQEIISTALGVPRTAVTMAAGSLQRDGLIRYSRGKIMIIDRARLETRSCECYRMMRDEVNTFGNT